MKEKTLGKVLKEIIEDGDKGYSLKDCGDYLEFGLKKKGVKK